ncbi:MAG: branched chain amino acid aminotransferase, partial [candidate division Zixibacteria bacterium]|nr:branched chain amino acid aminotransferase [candidate division Zixibacteria bacterium]
MEKVDKIWMNGEFVDWDDAKIHVLSHVVHYGSSIFEGLRCYRSKRGS